MNYIPTTRGKAWQIHPNFLPLASRREPGALFLAGTILVFRESMTSSDSPCEMHGFPTKKGDCTKIIYIVQQTKMTNKERKAILHDFTLAGAICSVFLKPLAWIVGTHLAK